MRAHSETHPAPLPPPPPFPNGMASPPNLWPGAFGPCSTETGVGERGRNSEAQDPTVPKGGKGDEGRTKPPNPSARKIKAEAVDQMGDALAGGKGRRAQPYMSPTRGASDTR